MGQKGDPIGSSSRPRRRLRRTGANPAGVARVFDPRRRLIMRPQAASLALLFSFLGLLGLLGFLGLPSAAGAAASLTHDWARIYNPAGSETILGMLPAPGGGVDMAVDNAGQLVYIQYNAAGTLTLTRATGVGISTMPFRVFESDGAGGFVL